MDVDVDVDVDVEKRESLGSTGAVTMENNTEFPQKIKNRATYDPPIWLLVINLKKTKTLTQKDICTTATLFTIAKTWM